MSEPEIYPVPSGFAARAHVDAAAYAATYHRATLVDGAAGAP